MAPVMTTHRRWNLGNDQFLDVVRNDTDQEVILTIGQNGTTRVKRRTAVHLSLGEGMQVARFLANITTLEPDEVFSEGDILPR